MSHDDRSITKGLDVELPRAGDGVSLAVAPIPEDVDPRSIADLFLRECMIELRRSLGWSDYPDSAPSDRPSAAD